MRPQLGPLVHIPLILAILFRLVGCQSNARFTVPSEGQVITTRSVFSITWEGFPTPPSTFKNPTLHLWLITGSNPNYSVLIWYDIVYLQNGTFDWIPPISVPDGTDYQTRLAGEWNPIITLFSSNFTITSSPSASLPVIQPLETSASPPASSSTVLPSTPTTNDTQSPTLQPQPSQATAATQSTTPSSAVVGGAVGGSLGAVIILLVLGFIGSRRGWFASCFKTNTAAGHMAELYSEDLHAVELDGSRKGWFARGRPGNPSELPAVELTAAEVS